MHIRFRLAFAERDGTLNSKKPARRDHGTDGTFEQIHRPIVFRVACHFEYQIALKEFDGIAFLQDPGPNHFVVLVNGKLA